MIQGIAAAGSITEIVAQIKGGKSTFIGYACRALLHGAAFLTYPTTPADVWWITEERPASFRRLLARTGLLEQQRIHVLMLQEAAPAAWSEMAASAVARSRRGDVLVADTIGRLAGLAGDAENSTGDALKAMEPIEAAAAAGLAVFVGRHGRKAGGEPENAGRGSSAWSGISDIVIQLSKAGASHPATVRKINSASRFEETPDDVLIQLAEDGYQLLGAEGALAYAEAEAAIREALRDGEMLKADLVKMTTDAGKPLGDGTVRRALDGMERLRQVEKLGRGGRSDPYRYVSKFQTARPPAYSEPGMTTSPNHSDRQTARPPEPVAASVLPVQQELEQVTALPYSGQAAEDPAPAPEMPPKSQTARPPEPVAVSSQRSGVAVGAEITAPRPYTVGGGHNFGGQNGAPACGNCGAPAALEIGGRWTCDTSTCRAAALRQLSAAAQA